MCLKHLTEAEVQIYLDSGRTELVDRVDSHIANCAPCRNAVLQYAAVFEGIANQPKPVVDAAFGERVLTRLATEPLPERESARRCGWLLPAVGIPSGAGAALYAMHLTGTLSLPWEWTSTSLSYVNTLVASYFEMLHGMEISPLLIAGIVGVALLGSQIDRLRSLANRPHMLA